MLDSTHKEEQKQKERETKMEKHLQVNEQCRIWQNNGKLEKQNQCKT